MADKYECDKCSACCRWPIIEITELDMIREPRLIPAVKPFSVPEGCHLEDDDGQPYEEVIPGYGAGGMLACGLTFPCKMLAQDGTCTIYPTRPNVCVAFQAGSEKCQEYRLALGLEKLLPKNNG